MNMSKMAKETESLHSVPPTEFVWAFCEFWMGAFLSFKRHLPEEHKLENEGLTLVSVEAVDAFRRCFNGTYVPKVKVTEVTEK
jgi:hypothetical protein